MQSFKIYGINVNLYAGKYSVRREGKIDDKELRNLEVKIIRVVQSEYGLSMRIDRMDGTVAYFPVSRDSDLQEGDVVDPNSLYFWILEKPGSEDIIRWDGKPIEE